MWLDTNLSLNAWPQIISCQVSCFLVSWHQINIQSVIICLQIQVLHQYLQEVGSQIWAFKPSLVVGWEGFWKILVDQTGICARFRLDTTYTISHSSNFNFIQSMCFQWKPLSRSEPPWWFPTNPRWPPNYLKWYSLRSPLPNHELRSSKIRI